MPREYFNNSIIRQFAANQSRINSEAKEQMVVKIRIMDQNQMIRHNQNDCQTSQGVVAMFAPIRQHLIFSEKLKSYLKLS